MKRGNAETQNAPEQLSKPKRVPGKINMVYALSFGIYHALIPVAFFSEYFSWAGLFLAILIGHLVGLLGINLCYHRCLAHQGMNLPKWLEYTLSIIGVINLQDHPVRWVTTHRMHHIYSDKQKDPHSPKVSFWWGHVGWLLVKTGVNPNHFRKHSPDLMKERFYVWLSKDINWVIIYFIHALAIYFAGFAFGWWHTGTMQGSMHAAVEWTLWGLVIRTVFTWHITWSVNSLTHLFGYRNHETGEDSRNNWLVGYLANGEGWHNNHHADPSAARHGVRWWEFDMTWQWVKLFRMLGLATDIRLPRNNLETLKRVL